MPSKALCLQGQQGLSQEPPAEWVGDSGKERGIWEADANESGAAFPGK